MNAIKNMYFKQNVKSKIWDEKKNSLQIRFIWDRPTS